MATEVTRKPDPLFATVITDGSFSDHSRKGGWAGRVICNGVRDTWWGPISSECFSSNDCEIAAVGNTLYFAIKDGKLPAGAGVYLQVDNKRTLEIVRKFTSPKDWSIALTPIETEVIKFLRSVVNGKDIRFLVSNHIKSHVNKHAREARHHVHEALDGWAKKGREVAEEEWKATWRAEG